MPKRRSRTRSQTRKRSDGPSLREATKRQIGGILLIAAGILLLLALRDRAGPAGQSAQRFVVFLFGSWGIVFPVTLIVAGLLHWMSVRTMETRRSVGLALCIVALLGIAHMRAPLQEIGPQRDALAGAVGFMVSLPFLLLTSRAVGTVVLSTVFLVGIVLAFEPDFSALVTHLRSRGARKAPRLPTSADFAHTLDDETEADAALDLVEEDRDEPELNIVRPHFSNGDQDGNGSNAPFARKSIGTEAASAKKSPAHAKNPDALEMKDTRFEEWTFPPLDLLDTARSALAIDDAQLKAQARMIEEKLKEFEIAVTVRDARPGPTVTQFTLEPAEGVKLSKIANLKDDLALALAAQSLRIEAPIPGKSLVGIEMPNATRTIVHLREILESSAFTQSSSALALPLGRDVSGEAVVESLDEMPHLLIAGATGAGKSVCMNVFLTALLFQNAPHELKFILIDPKRVELMPFNGIPHLLTPVITEAERALQALRWAVAEMGRRLHRFSETGVRNIDEFNGKQEDENLLLPRIVIVIDELADLMMRQFRRDTETMIVRIAQLARAVGMHLIVATQRPSVDVITGLIKANIPTRIAFRVVSAVDSRTIIDGIGAEDLLGKGDMLLMTARMPKPLRIQGIFVSTKEVEKIINAVKIAGGGRITEQIGMGEDGGAGKEDEEENGLAGGIDLEADDNGGDDLFFDAVRVVRETGKASASLLQRQLKVGYARAARLLDIMEEKRLIGPVDGAKPRKVFLSSQATSVPEPERLAA